MNKKLIISILTLSVFVFGCKKKTKELPAPETPMIEVVKLNENTYIFKNVTPTGGYGSYWEFDDLETSTKIIDTVFFGVKGTYIVKLTSNSKGGIATSQVPVTVNQSSPYAADFTIENLDPYRFVVTVVTPNVLGQSFTYPTGELVNASTTPIKDTIYYPYKGTKIFTLNVKVKDASGKEISATTKKKVTIADDDKSNPQLSNEVLKYLTGGLDANGGKGKTWVFDPRPFKSNVGSADNPAVSYYPYPDGLAGATWTEGALNNEYTFMLRDYVYAPKNTNATLHFDVANKFFGKTQGKYADIAFKDPKHAPANFVLNNDASNKGTGVGFTISKESYIGYNENRFKYYIVRISADTMYISHNYNGDENTTADPSGDKNSRSFTLIAKK